MAKRILSLTLGVVVFLSLASCSLTSYERRYPSYFTGEYVKEHYELIDMNLVYLESYQKRTSSISRNGQKCQFMKLKNVPLEQFVGMISYTSLFPEYFTYVLVNSNLCVNPIEDFEIEKIELYGKKGYLSIDTSNFDTYGKLIYSKQVCEIDNSEVNQEILESVRHNDREYLNISTHNTAISIRIHFKEYENIVWDAGIGEQDGKYYVKLILVDEEQKIFSHGNNNYAYVYVGPNFDALMESLLNR